MFDQDQINVDTLWKCSECGSIIELLDRFGFPYVSKPHCLEGTFIKIENGN